MRKQSSNSTTPGMSEAHCESSVINLAASKPIRHNLLLPLLLLLLAFALAGTAPAQDGGDHTLFGDLKVDEGKESDLKPQTFDVILYTEGGTVVSRERTSSNGRYRFMNLRNGLYDLAVEVENREVARIRVHISSPSKNDFRQDIAMEWHSAAGGEKREKASSISAADVYKRTGVNAERFNKAQAAIDKKDYEGAVSSLRRIVGDDPKDFQAWSELGTVYLMQKNTDEAEKVYQRALQEQPAFALAFINLGRLRLAQKNYEGAIDILSQAIKVQPQSADANYFLGEAYLQVKKGSKAVGHLNEAIRLDPARMAKAHLRLAALYNAAGMKDKAAAEYEQFLAKEPNHPDKKKLQQHITENKKP